MSNSLQRIELRTSLVDLLVSKSSLEILLNMFSIDIIYNTVLKEKVFTTFYDLCRLHNLDLPELFVKKKSNLTRFRHEYKPVFSILKFSQNALESPIILKGISWEKSYYDGARRDWHDIDILFNSIKQLNYFLKEFPHNYVTSKRSVTFWPGREQLLLFINDRNSKSNSYQIECQCGQFPITEFCGITTEELLKIRSKSISKMDALLSWMNKKLSPNSIFQVKDFLYFYALTKNFTSADCELLIHNLIDVGLFEKSCFLHKRSNLKGFSHYI